MQQVKCVPLLPVHNWFACLEVENENPLPPPLHAESPVKVTLESKTTLTHHLLCLCQWEKRLPKQYVVAATPGPKSLVIKVEIETTDTAEVKSGPTLIDCGATSQFMDRDYVEWNRLTTRKLQRAIPVFNCKMHHFGSQSTVSFIHETSSTEAIKTLAILPSFIGLFIKSTSL